MSVYKKTISAILAGVASTALAQNTAQPEVTVENGRLAGVSRGAIEVFKGIPFAAPPAGTLRWKPPQPARSWQGTRDATAFGPMCTQGVPDGSVAHAEPMSEDCLTLNVFSPAGAKTGARLPVMVWIYGGAFVGGWAGAPMFDGTAFASQGIILVTVNHRVGRLGFFAHPALSREQAGAPVGNYGMLDLIAALQWIQRNIHVFGGDKANVTLFGQSSGAALTNYLMATPLAAGLFQKAIAESGLTRADMPYLAMPRRELPSAEAAGKMFVDTLGFPSGTADELRAIPASALVSGPEARGNGQGPMIDGTTIVEPTDVTFAAGRQAHIPYIAGSNSQEAPPFFNVPAQSVQRDWWSDAEKAAIVRGYGSAAMRDAHIVGDVVFGESAHFAVGAQSKVAPTWYYRFSLMVPGLPAGTSGAPHGAEVAYVFNTLSAAHPPISRPIDVATAQTLQEYWVQFARTGDPNGGGRPVWPRYDAQGDMQLDFGEHGAVPVRTSDAAALNAIAATYAAKN